MGEMGKILIACRQEHASETETRTILELAESLGMEAGYSLPEHAPAGKKHTLVLLDLFSVDPDPMSRSVTTRWREQGGEALVLCGTEDEPRSVAGPRYRHWLAPREQLRHLSFRDKGGADALVELYAEQPGLYAQDREEPPQAFRDRVLASSGPETSWPDAWAETLRLLSPPDRCRGFDDLVLAPVPARIPLALVIEAAVCIGRVRHRWWRSGATPEAKPLVVVPHEGDRLGCNDPQWLLAGLAETRIYLPERLSGRLVGLGGSLKSEHPKLFEVHFDKEWRPTVSESTIEETAARERNRQLSQALSRLLIRGRPLRRYDCTFFFPFDPGRNEEPAFEKALPRREDPVANDQQVIRCCYPRTASDPEQARDETQAQLYFLPHIRCLLYEQNAGERSGFGKLEALREWRLHPDLISGWQLELYPEAGPGTDLERDGGDGRTDSLTADVESVRLFRYFNGTYLLALRVALPELVGNAAAIGSDSDDWWHPLACGDAGTFAETGRRRLSDWLSFTRLARILYPSFVEQHEEHKIASVMLRKRENQKPWPRFDASRSEDRGTLLQESPGKGLSRIVRDLLACFFGQVRLKEEPDLGAFLDRWSDVYDDRMFVNVAYALAGPPRKHMTEKKPKQPPTRSRTAQPPEPATTEPVEAPMRRLFSLALFADRFEDACEGCDGYAYDPAWVDSALDASSLGMWDATGVYSGFTDIANVHLGTTGFFAETVARRHVPHAYERMLIQALFYQASLRRYNREIAVATDELTRRESRSPVGGAKFRLLRGRFIVFTNRYWFHELTPQMQGKRMFELQQTALGLDTEYELIKDEMERADEYMEASRNGYLQDVSDRIAKFGLFIAVAALWISVLPLIPLDGNIGPADLIGQVSAVLERWFLIPVVFVPPILISFGLWPLVRRWLEKPERDGKNGATDG